MKKIIYSLVGAILFGFLAIAIAWGLAAIFGPLYQSEDESTRNFKIFMLAFLVFVILGAAFGYRFSKK